MPTTGTSRMIWKMRQLMKRKPETAMVVGGCGELVFELGAYRRGKTVCRYARQVKEASYQTE